MRQNKYLCKIAGTFSLFLFLSLQTFAQTATPPAAGDGSEGNPYEISSLENLYWLSQSDTAWDKHYIQTVNINASSTSNWNNGSGFTPIGNLDKKFTGTYNGQYHKVDSLYIKRGSETRIGLFGMLKGETAKIEKLTLTNVDITGKKIVGSIVADNRGSINECSASGDVEATGSGIHTNTGGIAGLNKGTIKSSFSLVHVTSSGHLVGGLVGKNGVSSVIVDSYSQGQVFGLHHIGGLVGENYKGQVKYCYSTSSVAGTKSSGGGLIGAFYGGSIESSFWDVETSGVTESEGGTGLTTSEMHDFYTYYDAEWNFIDSWGFNPDENGGYPFLAWQNFAYNMPVVIEIEEVTVIDNTSATATVKINAKGSDDFTSSGVCWGINPQPTLGDNYTDEGAVNGIVSVTSDITGLNENNIYYLRPYVKNNDETIYGDEKSFSTFHSFVKPSGEGTQENPYEIANLNNLEWLMLSDTAWGKNYIQTADINASESANWCSGKGFFPIGNADKKFTGTYNGQYHKIDSLYINRGSETRIGLFGMLKGESATIEKLTLTDVDITGNKIVGSIVADNRGTINECSSSGDVEATGSEIHTMAGGLVGLNKDTIKNSFSSVHVSSSGHLAGGLSGKNGASALIINCYSQGQVWGIDHIGGLVGENYEGEVKYCYSTASVSGYSYVGGLIGKSFGGSIQKSFWDTQASGESYSDGGTGLTTSEMHDFYTYYDAEWNFMNSWGFNEAENNGYPFLAWEGFSNDIPFLVVATDENYDVAVSTAIVRGAILGLGDSNPTDYGICWNQTGMPTVEDDTTNLGTADTTKNFNSQLYGLEADTTYYVRAYATDNNTTVYGREISFSTLETYELHIGGSFSVADKVYDGTKDATITENNLTLEGLTGQDEIQLSNVDVSFAQSEIGTDITVSIDSAELAGADTSKYTLSLANAPTAKADITEVNDINIAEKENIKIYPNPFQNFIKIESESEIKKIEVIDMSGKLRIRKNSVRRFNTPELEPGVYIIILEDAHGNKYQSKMIKR